MKPSKYQTAIYDWVQYGKGNCIVGAVAGSGKTSTAISSMPLMVGNVLSLAFNKRIAMALAAKLSNMGLPNARAATFHSEGMQNLIKSKGRVNVTDSKVYFITERYCQTPELIAAIPFIKKLVGFAKEYAFGVKGQRSIDDNEAWMEIIQTQDISLDADVDFYEVIDIAKDVLRESNRDFRNIDFADMIYLPLIYDIKCTQYDWVIVDEAQDTNVTRKLFIAKILKDGGRLLIIGDENQAIYAFTGAESDSMNLLKEMFNCIELPLSICYRCGKNIIKEAQKYQPHIEAFEENGDGEIVSMKYDDLLAQVDTMNLSAKDGIICRNNAPNVALAFALIRKGIGCRIEGRDIGQNLITLCNKWKVKDLNTFTERLVKYFDREFEKASKAKMQLLEDKMETMIILIERCQALGQHTVESLKTLISNMFTDSGDVKNANIVTLSSIHKAKGLEFENAYLMGMAQFVPSKYAVTEAQLKQERNLSYVAVTRAMKKLAYITDVPTRNNKPQEEAQ
jgi:DNA helicase-2/ATP-dependent DNA helicase PcrA